MDNEKQRRMEIRKETGSRNIVPPSSPPFHKGPAYAMSFACFVCRKSFKRHFDVPPIDYPDQKTCPECGNSSINLGRNFKAPKRSDEKQWEKVQFLVEHGFFFQKIKVDPNSDDTIPYPRTLEEAQEFVKIYAKYAVKNKIT